MTALNAAVVGCGDVSAVHLQAIKNLPVAQLTAVCDIDAGRLATAASTQNVQGFTNHISMIETMNPEVVHIATPHHTHATIAVDCLERGINVILEKPLAHTLKEGRRLIEAARASNAKIAVCFQNRYNSTAQAMYRLIHSGTLGQLLGASATVMWHRDADYYHSRPWRGSWEAGGGGLMMNQAIHTVDLLQWLMGDVVSLSGNSSTRVLDKVIEVEDTAEFVATHANGAQSLFYASLANSINAPVTLDIVTEKAVLSLRDSLTVTHGDGHIEVIPEIKRNPGVSVPTGGRAYWGLSHELLIKDFYAQIGEEKAFWIDAQEAYSSLAIVKELYRQSYPTKLEIVS